MLRRNLTALHVQLISFGGIIGSSYFLGVGELLAENGPWTILTFLIAGMMAWLVAMAMGELCVGMPREGGFVSHACELVNRPVAAGVGWSYWFNWCAYIPSEMIAGGLILHHFVPAVPVIAWAGLFALTIMLSNLLNVRNFGNVESALALLKIAALLAFSGAALFIWFRLGGQTASGWHAGSSQPFRPLLTVSFLGTLVLGLVNFQGTEIIALSAAETKDPQRNIPRVVSNVAWRGIGLYVIPLLALLLIFPAEDGVSDHSVFDAALTRYGLTKLGLAFQCVIVGAALSCANSGLYGAARALYSLSREGLAPVRLAELNAEGVPTRALWLTMLVSLAFLPLYFFFEGTKLYTWLLSVSGFTGAICWISITWCQIRLRKRLALEGFASSALPYAMPGYPYLSWFSLILQLLSVAWLGAHPGLRSSLMLGVPAFVLPTLIYWWKEQTLVRSALKGRAAGARARQSE